MKIETCRRTFDLPLNHKNLTQQLLPPLTNSLALISTLAGDVTQPHRAIRSLCDSPVGQDSSCNGLSARLCLHYEAAATLALFQIAVKEIDGHLLQLASGGALTPWVFWGYSIISNCLPASCRALVICSVFWNNTLSSSKLWKTRSLPLRLPALGGRRCPYTRRGFLWEGPCSARCRLCRS